MRGHARVALAIVVAVACVTVLAVSLTDEQRAADETVLETAAPPSQAKAPVETQYEKSTPGDGHWPAFESTPTGAFSRRRAKLAPQDATGKQFDKMFSQYFHNPSLDLENHLKAAKVAEPPPTVVGTMGAPATKTVEVIKELEPIHKAPMPDAEKPPVVEVVNGKKYTVKKVISVQKKVPGAPLPVAKAPAIVKPPAPVKPAVPPVAHCATCVASFKLAAGCTQWKAGADVSSLIKHELGCSECASEIAAACGMQTKESLKGNVAPTATTTAPVPPKPELKPATPAAKPAPVEVTETPAPSTAPSTVAAVVTTTAPHTATTKAPVVGRPVVLPPIDVSSEPTVGNEPLMAPALAKAPPTPAKPPKEVVVAKPAPVQEKPAPVKPAPVKAAPVKKETETPAKKIKVVADDGSFGTDLTPKKGPWTDGDSDYSQNDEPWKPDGTAWPPMALAQELDVEAEDDAAPWESNADAAPWEQAPSEAVNDATGLLQMAAHSCAARKAEQRKSCKHAEAVAAKECEASDACDHKRDFAHKFCDRTAKAALKECFNDWRMAKAQQ